MDRLAVDSGLRFAVRPRPRPGEATIGYLTRVAAANGHASLGQLFSVLRSAGESRAERALNWLELDEEERALLKGPLPAAWAGGTLPLGVSVQDFNAICRRWCPLCLQDDGFIRWEWTLKMLCVCGRHGVWLHESCQGCGNLQRWGPSGIAECSCGSALARQPAAAAPRRVLQLSRSLLGDPSDALASRALSSVEWHRFLLYMGQFSDTSTPLRPGKVAELHSLPVASAQVETAAALLDDWPKAFNQVLHRLQLEAVRQPSLQLTFSPLYRVLYRELRDDCFGFLRVAFEAFIHENWWGTVCRRNRRLPQVSRATHPRFTVTQAAHAAGVPICIAKQLIQAELVGVESAALPSGRTQRTLHQAEVDRLRALASGSLPLRVVAELLCLPERRVRQMIGAGLMAPVVSRSGPTPPGAWAISRQVIAPLMALPSTADADEAVEVRAALRYARLSDGEAVELLRHVVAGGFGNASHMGASRVLGLVRLRRADLDAWLREGRRGSDDGCSLDEAASLLGIKQQVAYDLARAGLLRVQTRASGVRRVTQAEIDCFKRDYVALAVVAASVGRSPVAVLRTTAAEPVCGPTIDGSKQYFFRRADVTADQGCRSDAVDGHSKRR
jgi:hypothetical protein